MQPLHPEILAEVLPAVSWKDERIEAFGCTAIERLGEMPALYAEFRIPEPWGGQPLTATTITSRRLRNWLRFQGVLLLSLLFGCSHDRCCYQPDFSERILLSPKMDSQPEPPTPVKTPQATAKPDSVTLVDYQPIEDVGPAQSKLPAPPAEMVPLLLILPKNAPKVLTPMPVCFAEITPLLSMLLTPPALLFPKAPVIFLTRIPAPNLLATFPLLLMPPPNVVAFLTTMALLPAEIVP